MILFYFAFGVYRRFASCIYEHIPVSMPAAQPFVCLSYCPFVSSKQTLSPLLPLRLHWRNPFAFLARLPPRSISPSPSPCRTAPSNLTSPPPIHPSTHPPPTPSLCPRLTLLGLIRCRCPFGSGTAGAESRVPLPPLSPPRPCVLSLRNMF